MDGWKRILWTLGLVFCVTIAQSFLNAGGDLFSLDWSTAQLMINAGIGAVLAVAVNFVAPWIKQYGLGSEPTE